MVACVKNILRRYITKTLFQENVRFNNKINHVSPMWKRRMSDSTSPAGCKVAVISGGSIGIGHEFVKALLKCGAKGVVFGDVREKEGEEAAGKLRKEYGEKKVTFMKCDVTKENEFEAMFKTAWDKYKQLDIVINNAGVLQEKQWTQLVDVNVKGIVRGTLLGFKHMGRNNKGRGGVIVNVASIYGLQQAYPCPVYNGAKGFVVRFSNAMSHEYYEKLTGVKVFTICPGVTQTHMVHESAKHALEGFGDLGKELSQGLADLPTQPPEVCGKCLMKILCADENGGIFVIEESECYKINLPDRHTLRACD